MPTMTVTITDVPSFAAVGLGYKITGKMSLPEVVKGPIKINSMRLYYGKGRTYMAGPYLTAVCGDTTFRTDYFTIKDTGTSSVKERDMNVLSWSTGDDHLLKVDGRSITFTVARDNSTSSNVVDRPAAYNVDTMTLTVNYTLLFEPSAFNLSSTSIEMGEALIVSVPANSINADFVHTASLDLNGLLVSGSVTGPGDIVLTIPRTSEWLAALPGSVTGSAAVALKTDGADQSSTSTKYIDVLVPGDVVPSIEDLTVARIDGRVPALWGAFVQGESAATITIEGTAPGEGSEILDYRIEGGGYAGNAAVLTTGKLFKPGDTVFTATVTDARGRMAVKAVSVSVEPYTLPRLDTFAAWRVDAGGVTSDAGEQIAVRATFGIAELHDNEAVFAIFVNGQAAEIAQSEKDASSFTAMLPGPYSATSGFEVVIEIRDAITASSSSPATLSDKVPSANVPAHAKNFGNDFGWGFGRYAEREKTLAIPEDWRFIRGETDIEQKADEAKTKAEEAYEKAENAGRPLDFYHVGAVYISADPTSPAGLFGGVWEQLKDRFLLGAGDTYTAGDTGGSATHTLTVDEMPSHTHEVWGWKRAAAKGSSAAATVANNGDGAAVAYNRYEADQMTGTAGGCISPVVERGGGLAHSIMPPYLAVYMWRRTA